MENDRGIMNAKGDALRRWSEVIDSMVMPGIQGGPLMHVIAGKAVAFKEAQKPEFVEYIDHVLYNAKVMAQALTLGGARIVSGGTDNHLMLVDLTPLGINGRDAEKWLDEANITVNKNSIPFDKKSAFVTSGIRIGTPAITTRGMGPSEMEQIASFIMEVLKSKGDAQVIARIKQEVLALTSRFPLL
jgi:glycine hydroxymethyltransferase